MNEAFLGRASKLATDAIERRSEAAETAVNEEAARWHRERNTAAWNYGVWPLTVHRLCVEELAARSNCVLQAIKQAHLALPHDVSLDSDRDRLKAWARETLAAHTRDLERLLAEHVRKARAPLRAVPDLIHNTNRQQDTLALAIDQFVDTERNRGAVAAASVVIHGDGIAIVGDVANSTIQQGLTVENLSVVVEAVQALRQGFATASAPDEARARATAALDACAEELAQPKPNPSKLIAFLSRAGEVYRTLAATPAIVNLYEQAHAVLMRLL